MRLPKPGARWVPAIDVSCHPLVWKRWLRALELSGIDFDGPGHGGMLLDGGCPAYHPTPCHLCVHVGSERSYGQDTLRGGPV